MIDILRRGIGNMKKFTLILLFIIYLCFSVEAYGATFNIKELNMNVNIPDNLIVFTREIATDDKNLTLLGLDKATLENHYKENFIYFNAINVDPNFEIIITMQDYEGSQLIFDFNELKDSELMSIGEEISKNNVINQNVITYKKYSIYNHDQAKFLKIYFEQLNNSEKVQSIQNYTIINGQAINITMHSYSGIITNDQETMLDEIINSISFTQVLRKPSENETNVNDNYAPIAYKNDEAGVEFVVPAGWRDKALMKERITIKVKFVNDKGNTILFGYTDLYNDLSQEDKVQIKRSDFNNSALSKEDVIIFLKSDNTEITKIDTEIINNIEYYKLNISTKKQVEGTDYNFNSIIYFFINDGIGYHFQYGGDENDQYYNDFTSMMRTIKYDIYDSMADTLKLASGVPLNYSDKYANWYYILSLLLVLIYTIVVYTLPIIIYRYGIAKHPFKKRKALMITIIWYSISLSIVILIANYSGDKTPGSAAILWTYLNYRILTTGKDKRKIILEDVKNAVNSSEMVNTDVINNMEKQNNSILNEIEIKDMDVEKIEEDQINLENLDIGYDIANDGIVETKIYCNKCGTQLTSDSNFCFRCGNKVRL
jgi:hypothetical protein